MLMGHKKDAHQPSSSLGQQEGVGVERREELAPALGSAHKGAEAGYGSEYSRSWVFSSLERIGPAY